MIAIIIFVAIIIVRPCKGLAMLSSLPHGASPSPSQLLSRNPGLSSVVCGELPPATGPLHLLLLLST